MQRLLMIFATISGIIIEYYDYALYSFLATHIRDNFLPQNQTEIQNTIQILTIFAAAPIAKPIGAYVFGYIGDKYGRAKSLKINIIGITIATLIIGITPSYKTIGILSTLTIFLCRIIQGICIGGESDNISIYLIEHFKKKPFFANSLIGFCSGLGIFLASFVATFIVQDNSDLWRFAFIISSLFGILIFILRNYLPEPEEFLDKKYEWKPFTYLIKENKYQIAMAILLCGSVSGIYKFYFIFLNQFIPNILKVISYQEFQLYITYGISVYMISILITGYIADYISPIKILQNSITFLIICTILNAYMLNEKVVILPIILMTASGIALLQTTGIPLIVQSIKTNQRCRSLGIGHSLGSSIIGSTTPIISTLIWHTSKNVHHVMFYFAFLVTIAAYSITFYDKQTTTKLVDKQV